MSRFTRRSTMRALLTIAAEYVIIAGAIAIAVDVPDTGWPVKALAILVIGTRQYALGEALCTRRRTGTFPTRSLSTTCLERSSPGRSSRP